METIFSRIIAGEIPCHKVAEDAEHLAFLDINPITMGHVLVIPKRETDYLFDMEDEALSSLMLFSKRVARALKHEVLCKKIGVSVIGLEVPHAHVHLVPINSIHDMRFGDPISVSPEQLKALADKILVRFI